MTKQPSFRIIALPLATCVTVFALSGCGVRRSLHQAALDAIVEARAEKEGLEATLLESKEREQALKDQVDALDLEAQAAQKERDQWLARSVANEGTNQTSALLAEAEAAMALFRKAQQREQAQLTDKKSLTKALKNRIEERSLSVRKDETAIVVELRQDLLFPAGSAGLNSVSRPWVEELATALVALGDRNIEVGSHSDSQPPESKYSDNWELSAARAAAVARIFAETGLPAANITAIGFGEHQPRADNGSPEGRSMNRRIEVRVRP